MHLHQPLAHSALESFEKLTLKKKTKRLSLNGHISKTRTNSESKLRFSSGSFNVLENCVVFCALYPCKYTTGSSIFYKHRRRYQRQAGFKGLSNAVDIPRYK